MCAQRWPASHTQLKRKSRLVWLACAVGKVLMYRPTELLSSKASGPGTGRRWGVGGEAGCWACAVDTRSRSSARRDEELSGAGVNPAFNRAFWSRRCRRFPGENAGRALGGEQTGSTLQRSRARPVVCTLVRKDGWRPATPWPSLRDVWSSEKHAIQVIPRPAPPMRTSIPALGLQPSLTKIK